MENLRGIIHAFNFYNVRYWYSINHRKVSNNEVNMCKDNPSELKVQVSDNIYIYIHTEKSIQRFPQREIFKKLELKLHRGPGKVFLFFFFFWQNCWKQIFGWKPKTQHISHSRIFSCIAGHKAQNFKKTIKIKFTVLPGLQSSCFLKASLHFQQLSNTVKNYICLYKM